MLKLTINNSECCLEGLSIAQFNSLKRVLSYVTQPAPSFNGIYRSKRVSLIDKKGRFPTGCLQYAREWLRIEKIKFSVDDLRRRPIVQPGRFSCVLGVSPRTNQLDAAIAARKHERGVIVAPTGSGKSVIIALIVDLLQVNTLIVVPNLELKRQLTQSLKRAFGNDVVGTIKEKAKIAVENIDSLDPDKPMKGYDCVILDEFHHAAASTYRKLNKKTWTDIYYRFGLTATPFRSQDNEKILLESVLSEVIYCIEYKDAVANGFIVPMEAYYIELPRSKIKGNSRSWTAMYKELVVENMARNAIIVKLLMNLKESGLSTLCLVKEIAHGEILSDATGIDFVKGENTDNRIKILEFNLKEKHALIGTTGVIGEGIDTKPCEYVIIAGLGKSKNALMQQFGRGFRTYENKETCKIILFYDTSHKWTKEHFKTQCKILLEEYGVIPAKISI